MAMQFALDLSLVVLRLSVPVAVIGALVMLLLTPDPCLPPGARTPTEQPAP